MSKQVDPYLDKLVPDHKKQEQIRAVGTVTCYSTNEQMTHRTRWERNNGLCLMRKQYFGPKACVGYCNDTTVDCLVQRCYMALARKAERTAAGPWLWSKFGGHTKYLVGAHNVVVRRVRTPTGFLRAPGDTSEIWTVEITVESRIVLL